MSVAVDVFSVHQTQFSRSSRFSYTIFLKKSFLFSFIMGLDFRSAKCCSDYIRNIFFNRFTVVVAKCLCVRSAKNVNWDCKTMHKVKKRTLNKHTKYTNSNLANCSIVRTTFYFNNNGLCILVQ